MNIDCLVLISSLNKAAVDALVINLRLVFNFLEIFPKIPMVTDSLTEYS